GHNTGFGHPERAERIAAFIEGLEAGGASRTSFGLPRPANTDEIIAVHPWRYVETVERVCESLDGETVVDLPTGDTVISHDSYAVALEAAGAALAAAAAARIDQPAIAVIRPPGHHAEPARGMGFCVFNNVAIASAWALKERGNVLIVDFDYHHGNGTQAWVESVLGAGRGALGFVSSHAYPAYPGTGGFDESQIRNNGFVIDLPLSHATDTDDFVALWAHVLPAAAEKIQPKTILVSAGFDFLAGDPIAGLPVAPRAVDALCGLLGEVGSHHNAPLALVLEGGYSLDNLRTSGSSLASDFGKHAPDVHVPDAKPLRDPRLHTMVEQVRNWLA
ncbi:MAG: histone deacetylase, partial [Candidatus Eremiobacteraeota bacterium]|nr:histone deacetylase [Candidatus Eremiobacteraeota bacterium]